VLSDFGQRTLVIEPLPAIKVFDVGEIPPPYYGNCTASACANSPARSAGRMYPPAIALSRWLVFACSCSWSGTAQPTAAHEAFVNQTTRRANSNAGRAPLSGRHGTSTLAYARHQ